MTSFDAIVIGGGHNGLTAATLLAQKGRKVVLLEATDALGGAIRGYAFHPGFISPGLAHVVNRLDPKVARAMGVAAPRRDEVAPIVVLSENGPPAILRGGYGETLDGVSPAEAAGFAALRRKLLLHAGILKRFLKRAPPEIGDTGIGDLAAFASAGLGLISKGREEARDFARMLLMNVADLADEYLSDDRLKGLLAFDATLGIHLGPRSPTSLLGLYYRLTGETGDRTGAQVLVSQAAGIAGAFEQAARRAGVTIRTGTAVERIMADRGVTSGVVLAGGEVLTAPVVISAIHPETTFLDLVAPAELGTGFLRSVRGIRSKGNVAKLDLGLSRVPEFAGVSAADLRGRLVIARSVDHVEKAFNPAKYGEFSADPVMEITLPSLGDPSMAPVGHATLSALVQYAPYELKAGWEKGKPAFRKAILDVLERYSPGIGGSIVAESLLTPADMEAKFNLPGGHWHHGELQVDQLLVNRPVHAASRYATPLKGLYLASAGAHPGGGLSGLPGLLAANRVLSGERP
ncbi:NAD(P)/FAD-dependent oxidoreductase [Rhizobium sp. BK251]|uniref:phytoene desaturase family protein n=1 Tax=Rhizobium sp. BK251 TaxID=2512125 RepID=UPI001052EB45|nr:NAD(P)/FAD-dependent oxidoreductase [Rhizobium sp. BK251]TCL71172.1 phytoene dehydrogenase-like protein [Rhizobium sp. BK251]